MDAAGDWLRVVLVAPRNPLNIGAAARAMSNFGFSRLRLVRPYDVAFREARSAVRSRYILEQAEIFDSIADAIADCSLVAGTTAVGNRDLHVPLHRLEGAGPLLRAHLQTAPAALLFGSEKFGLSNEDMSYCHWLLRIPSREEHGSMNLGQAVSICLYELRRDSDAVRQFSAPERADSGQYEQVTALLLDILHRSGYINQRTSKSSEMKIRRLVQRLGLGASDTETWLGIFRQILWRTKQGEPVQNAILDRDDEGPDHV
ncbi:MAG: RNA methyltransferase [Acidobacteriaceae bacterium]|nr:RNA methyltransferase [Acidobacteriaceae bacterium]